ncbi:sulfotransferase family 2 domain-containing protein [Aestuariibacter sp. A3R04]|uniref:sulfotransferase family 2 domain-containing protein n=1 Tax=Aestuariibacter sp. A3R04 TaxID=2841571 RepID=UPI001C080CC1|nr:sulfotransferase family 2 domain-containing protein [Aestuariibacter sp. A3R04]MBU3020866.1 sulfotransferase family 2 domain-containing protein [Aestuariibacter sp. A3R04]
MQEMFKRQLESFLERYPKIFFCHVPKCAGVSLSNAIYRAIYPVFLKATRYSGHISLPGSRQCESLLGINMMTAREAQLIFQLSNHNQLFTTGHCVARPEVVSEFYKDWHFLTILRNPVDRFISEYVYNRFKASEWQKDDREIEAYLASEKAIHSALTYARYFSGIQDVKDILAAPEEAIARSVANLRRFSVVGTLDKMAKWEADFNQRFNASLQIGSKNASPNRRALASITDDKKLMESITALSQIDTAIYEQVSAW